MAFEYWPVEYAADAIDALFEIEAKVPKFLFQSPQVSEPCYTSFDYLYFLLIKREYSI